MTLNVQRKNDKDVLLALQKWYPMLTGFTWGTDGEASIEVEGQLKDGMIQDILEYLRSDKVWEAVQVG